MSQKQKLVMEADFDDFVIVEKYRNALPRANKDELKALDQKMIQRGQQEPIKVRRDMGILNGYTRHELLGERGKKIKYEFREFDSEEEEFAYVVESNIMQRHLNIFQRVEAMYNFFLEETLARREKNFESQFDILQAVKNGAKTTTGIQKATKYNIYVVRRHVKELKDSYYLHEGDTVIKQFSHSPTYTLMPKGEEALSKREPKKIGSVSNILSKIIGVGKSSVDYSVRIIRSEDNDMIQQCRDGTLSVRGANALLNNSVDNRRIINRKGITHVNRYTRLKCPNCEHTAMRKEYEVVQ